MKTTRFKHINNRSFTTSGDQVMESGDAFQLFESSSALNIEFFGERGETILYAESVTSLTIDFVARQLSPFTRFTVKSVSGTVTPDFYISTGLGVVNNRFSGVVSIEKGATVTGGAQIVASGAVAQTIAASANRKKLNIRSYDVTNTGTKVFVGSSDATHGVPLLHGEARTFDDFNGALNVYFDGAGILWFDEEF